MKVISWKTSTCVVAIGAIVSLSAGAFARADTLEESSTPTTISPESPPQTMEPIVVIGYPDPSGPIGDPFAPPMGGPIAISVPSTEPSNDGYPAYPTPFQKQRREIAEAIKNMSFAEAQKYLLDRGFRLVDTWIRSDTFERVGMFSNLNVNAPGGTTGSLTIRSNIGSTRTTVDDCNPASLDPC